jgi:nucleotide-binding universal stress UspA family protein
MLDGGRREMWKRILVPLDGSNLAERALAYVEELATAFNSEVILLYVSEPKEEQYRPMHQLYLEEVAKRVKEHVKKRARIKMALLTGEAAEEIINYARKNKASVIIMASHGRSGITAWVMGNVANNVLRAAEVPVLLIRVTKPSRKVPPKRLVERVLLPLDGSERGEVAVPYVKKLINKLGVEVILLGVVAAGQHIRTVGGLDYILYPEAELELVKAEAKEYLDRVYQRLKGGRGALRLELKVSDDVAGEIIKFADKAKATLIAISAHGHSGIEKWVFGSVANKIVQASKIPVLVVRATGEKP